MKKLDKITIKIYIPIFTGLVLIILSVIAVYTKMDQKDKKIENSFDLDHKQVYQAVYGNNAKKCIEKSKNSAIKLNLKISENSRNSQIKKINDSAEQSWIRCDKEVIELIEKAVEISKMSNSTFDITSGKLIDLWNIGIKDFNPDLQDIKGAMSGIDYNFIKINKDVNRVKLSSKLSKVTLDGLINGAICDLIIRTCHDTNVDYGITSVGNVTGVYGVKPDSSFWRLSVKDSAQNKNEELVIAFVKTLDGYMCNLINSEADGGSAKCNQGAVIDLRTGYPCSNQVSSVAILNSDAVVANILAYVCCVLDRSESKQILDYYKAGAIFIYKDKSIYVTDNVKENFVITNKEYNLIN